MDTREYAPPGEDPRVGAAVAEFLAAQDAGSPPDPLPWLAGQPEDVRSELRGCLEMMGLLTPGPSGRPPTIRPVSDYGVLPGPPERPFFSMRLVGRRTLADAIAEYHARPTDAGRNELLRQFIAACGAVGYAHAQGVVHRDLKPANVMVGS